MKDQKGWDPSLVKKFSSSNHYKLLNQLKNEVKKYPLNNKKKGQSINSKDINQDTNRKSQNLNTKNVSLSINSNHSSDTNSSKSTVSFNNAKNFSIYNNSNTNKKNDRLISDNSISNGEISSQTFKERLDQVDLK